MRFEFAIIGSLLLAGSAKAHLAAFANGMYCRNGTVKGVDNQNNDDPVSPLWKLSKKDWWFHHVNQCDEFPPADGEFLELPAGGSFTVEIASNRGSTTLSFDSKYASEWPDGGHYPEGYSAKNSGGVGFPASGCILSPNMHTQNESMAAGTAFAISYESDLSKVTPENLAVFSVRYHTPWKRVTSYDVPAEMPACPKGGCICAWGWVPNGCGEPNMYMLGYKCNVTGATSTTPIAAAKPPVWCEGEPNKCVKGAKQLIYWNQLEGDNIEVSGNDLSGNWKSPAYNNKLGFSDGAQNDIFTSGSNSSGGAGPHPGSSSVVPSSYTHAKHPSSTPIDHASPPSHSPSHSPAPCKSKGKKKGSAHRPQSRVHHRGRSHH